MFGLPAAAIAMWHSARPESRKVIGGIMISAALTSFLTGITEPIEFSFVFVAPVLYLMHAVLAGFADFLFTSLGGRMGFTFSHGAIDFILFYGLGTRVWLIPLLAPLFAVCITSVFASLSGGLTSKHPVENRNTATKSHRLTCPKTRQGTGVV